MKELTSGNKDEFDLEVKALQKFKSNPHLVTLFTSYEHRQRYYLLFGWAEGGNLFDLWKMHNPNPEFDRTLVLWLGEQCLGLADGLHRIHNTQLSFSHEPEHRLAVPGLGNGPEDKTCGRHGDIKPQNILWFKHEPNKYGHGVLKISDFGLARFHSYMTTKVSPVGISVSQTYKAPEFELNEEISRPYDVWSLGCLYLEFITWLVLGWQGVNEFSLKRCQDQDCRAKFHLDTFFNLWRQEDGQEESKATVKIAVKEVSTPNKNYY